jgi:glycosyltransferase involved in cell wall biosynthesis
MRVLHLTPELPAPAGVGGAVRQFHLLRRLVELGHEIDVVAPVAPAQEGGAESLREAGVALDGVPRPRSRVVEALRAMAIRPGLAPAAALDPVLAWQVAVFWTRMRSRAHRLLVERSPDLISVEHDYSAGWIRDLPSQPPAVLGCHNVSWHYYERRAQSARGLSAPAFRLERARFLRYDRRHLPRYHLLIAVSERDREDLVRVAPVPCEVVANGVAPDAVRPTPEPPGPATLLFTGTMNYAPNSEGILWFASRIWPEILALRPDARLLIVGRDPPPRVRELAASGVEVTGEVPDVAPYFARATVAVVPLRSGGGSRLKVLEALAAGRAVVSTSVGAEGLELEHGVHLLLEDEPGAFAAATLRLLDDAELRARLAAAGHRRVEEHYDWRVLGERLEELLRSVARRRQGLRQ